eukprot:829565-Amphidinium_carterae.2
MDLAVLAVGAISASTNIGASSSMSKLPRCGETSYVRSLLAPHYELFPATSVLSTHSLSSYK